MVKIASATRVSESNAAPVPGPRVQIGVLDEGGSIGCKVQKYGFKEIAVGALALLAADAAQAARLYGVDGNDNLLSFDSNLPAVFTSSVKISGATGILGLDFRPLNGALYALASDRVVYVIDPFTGEAVAQGGPLDLGVGSTHFAFDFNPTIDRLRIITNGQQANNFVFNPLNFQLTTATSVFYAAGDANAPANLAGAIDVIAAAYTTSVFGAPAGTTQLYGRRPGPRPGPALQLRHPRRRSLRARRAQRLQSRPRHRRLVAAGPDG